MSHEDASKSVCCPGCKGRKTVFAHMNTGMDSSKHQWGEIKCLTCGGRGEISQEHLGQIETGMRLYKARISSGETLFEAATRQGMTSAQLSAIEHGRLR